jgi:hypothetical protein
MNGLLFDSFYFFKHFGTRKLCMILHSETFTFIKLLLITGKTIFHSKYLLVYFPSFPKN